MTSFFDIIHKPGDCLLLVAFPLTEEDFYNDIDKNSNKDYVKTTATTMHLVPRALWQYHHLPLVNVIHAVSRAVSEEGVTVRLNTTLTDLNDLTRFKVITLVAHYNDEKRQLELCDGLHNMEDVKTAFDDSFKGVIDLSVCNSVTLQDVLKEKFGESCFIRANRKPAEIKTHLILYKKLIEILKRSTKNYISEMLELRAKLSDLLEQKL